MKQLSLLAAAILSATLPAAAFTADIDGTTFSIDTVYHHVVGPGVTKSALTLTAPGRSVSVFISTLSRSQGATAGVVEPRVVLGKDKCQTAETLTSMASRHSQGDYRLLTGINGDFFITSSFASQHEFGNAILGYPNMACAIDGKIAAPDMIDVTSRENALVITNDNWYIDATDFKYRVLNNDGSTVVDATAVNYPRRDGEMVVYNSYMGASTATAAGGRELVLRMAEGAAWNINKTTKFIVDTDWANTSNTAIPADGLVISCGPKYSNAFIDGLKKGDIVKLKIVVGLPAHENAKPDIKHIIGGDVRILNNGEITRNAIRWINTPSSKYQRSLVGFSADRDLMVIAAVDGTGLTYYESAALMKALGCNDALDFDGGGSTAIWSDAHGIYNKPRDGSERAIGNALFFTLKAPKDNKVASIRFADHALTLPRYGSFTPVIFGYNQYGQLVNTNVTDFTLSAPEALGTTSDKTLLASGAGTHLLTATTPEGYTATLVTTVDATYPARALYPSIIIDNNLHPRSIRLVATVGQEELPVDPRAFNWQSSDEQVVTVDAEGNLIGVADGSATVTGSNADTKVEVSVVVQCPTLHAAPLILATDTDWATSATSGKAQAPVVNADASIDIPFSVTKATGAKLTLKATRALWSIPDHVEIDMTSPNCKFSKATISLKPANDRPVTSSIELSPSASAKNIRFSIADILDVDNHAIYPVTFQSIALVPDASAGDYNLHVNSINAIYDAVTDAVNDITAAGDVTAPLRPIVNGSAIAIPFRAESLELFDASGRKVASAQSASAIHAPAAGLYFMRADGQTAKIVVR